MWVQIPELPFMSWVSKQFIMCASLFLSEKSGQGITGFINKYMPQIVQHRVRLSKKYLIISSSSLKKDTTSIFQPMCWVLHSKLHHFWWLTQSFLTSQIHFFFLNVCEVTFGWMWVIIKFLYFLDLLYTFNLSFHCHFPSLLDT